MKDTNKIKVAFFDTKPYDREYFDRFENNYPVQIKYFPVKLNADTASLSAGYNAVCAFVNDEIDAKTTEILHMNGITLIAMRCAGYNNIDLEAVWNKIHVVRVPSYSPHAVAEHAIALLMSLNRKTHKAYVRTRDGNFTLSGLTGFDLFGKTAGIVGTGQIGRIAAQIMRGFGMNVLAADPYPDALWAKEHGVQYTSTDALFAASDVISLHCPLTPENHHLINKKVLDSMKEGALIVNTGRGGLIDASALIAALKSGKLGGAGLDVYEEEDKYFFEDHSHQIIQDDVLARLLTFPNVMITSHQAFLTREALSSIAQTTLGNISGFFKEGSLPNEICYRCTQKNCTRKTSGKCF